MDGDPLLFMSDFFRREDVGAPLLDEDMLRDCEITLLGVTPPREGDKDRRGVIRFRMLPSKKRPSESERRGEAADQRNTDAQT